MKSAERNGVLEGARLASPYTLPLVVVPALLLLTPMRAPESSPQVSPAAISVAASELGANVDSYFTAYSTDLAQRVAEAEYQDSDVTLPLRPNRRYVVQGRIVRRNRSLGLAEDTRDFDHLL